MISNITAGLPAQINKILENNDYILRLKTALTTEEHEVRNNKLQDFLRRVYFIDRLRSCLWDLEHVPWRKP